MYAFANHPSMAANKPLTKRTRDGRAVWGAARQHTAIRSQKSDNNVTQGSVVNEDVLARLRAAEEEAAKLRQQLADAQGSGKVRICGTVGMPAVIASAKGALCDTPSFMDAIGIRSGYPGNVTH
jgi:hypothetical protein